MRKLILLAALPVPISLVMLGAFAVVRLVHGFSWPSLAVLYAWVFGICGIVGLARGLFDRSAETGTGIRATSILLGAGIVSALGVSAILLVGWGMPPRRLWPLLLLFPVFPVLVALFEMGALARKRPARPRREAWRAWRLAAAILLLPPMLAAGRVVAGEAVIYGYGHDFLRLVGPAAARIAKGRPYCIVESGSPVAGFDSLDVRAMLSRTIRRQLSSPEKGAADPHFRIVVGDTAWWWSFRDDAFYYVPGHEWSVPPITCPAHRADDAGPLRSAERVR